MINQYSILHISDLHKPKDGNLDNLFCSLQQDCETYMKEGIRKPEIIVVSGDLVEGSKDPNAVDIIRKQYEEVNRFLKKLTDYFLGGDKKRIIIVPGNHDYCYMISKDSMTLSPEEKAKDDYESLWKVDSFVRWNWADRRYYHVNNRELYATRFDLFVNFYNSFFTGVRKLPEKMEKESYIIELWPYRIAFVCFNSCYCLDHLNPMGCISPDAVTGAHNRLSSLRKMGYLLVGVWHHHVSGLPVENNYMDYRILDAMMKESIKIGLFGHQHVSTAVQEYSDITAKQSILLISSGSLYGNRYQLVTGVPRQYNIIELEREDEEINLKLNVRSDNSQNGYAIPNWNLSPIGMKNLTCYKHPIKVERTQIEYVLEDIETNVKQNQNYENACMRLRDIGLDNDLALKYFDNYISKVSNPKLIKALLVTPTTLAQYMAALNGAMEAKDTVWLEELLYNESYQGFTNSFIEDLKEKAKRMLKLWKSM